MIEIAPENKRDECSRLVLGTAQLGMEYGVANRLGCPDYEGARSIVLSAIENGITKFDTAQAYGRSEEVLGSIFAELGVQSHVHVITKLHPSVDHSDRESVISAVKESVDRLGVRRLNGLLLHDEDHLDALGGDLGSALLACVGQGMVEHIGVSAYSPRKAIQAAETDICDIIQVPASVVDTRMEAAGLFERAKQRKKMIFIRSVFLQGLLLMQPDEVRGERSFAGDLLHRYKRLSDERRMTQRQLALNYIKHRYPDACVLFGAESADQVVENCDAWRKAQDATAATDVRSYFSGVDESVIDPSLWPEVR